jgi:hypothetical protein
MIERWIARGAHTTAEECPALARSSSTGGTGSSAVRAAHGTPGATICDDTPPDLGDFHWTPEAPLEEPKRGKGLQLYTPPRDVAPGTEWETCFVVRPNWRQLGAEAGFGENFRALTVKEQVYRMHQGSHHLLLWAYFGEHPDEWAEGYFPCSATQCVNPGDCPADAGDNVLPIGGTQVAGVRYEVKYPDGVGLPVLLLGGENTVLIVNLHYTNPFQPAQPIYGEAWLNLYFHAPGEFKALLDGIFAINFRDLIVEPYETKRGTLFQIDYVRGGRCSASGQLCGRDDDCRCKPWQEGCVEGQRCERGPDAEDTTIYRTTEWDNAPVVDFPKPYLLVNADQGLRWTCTHTNGVRDDPTRPPKVCHRGCRSCGWSDETGKCTFTRNVDLGLGGESREVAEGDPIPLVFGELADDDMCNMFGYFLNQASLPLLE